MFLVYCVLCCINACDVTLVTFIIRISRSYAILVGAEHNTHIKNQHSEPKDFTVLAYQEEIIMLNFDNKPYMYVCLQINGNTLGVKIGLFHIIYVSLSSKARQLNTQNHCISPLMLKNIFHLSGNTSAAANVLLQEAYPGFHSVPR
jgi:hypothetical protein